MACCRSSLWSGGKHECVLFLFCYQEAADDLTRVQNEKNATIQTLKQLLNSKEHEVQVQLT